MHDTQHKTLGTIHVHVKAPSTVQNLLPCWNFDLATVKESILYARVQACHNQANEWGEPIANLVIDEPVEVQDFTKITDLLRGINGIYLVLMKKTQKTVTCDWSDLET